MIIILPLVFLSVFLSFSPRIPLKFSPVLSVPETDIVIAVHLTSDRLFFFFLCCNFIYLFVFFVCVCVWGEVRIQRLLANRWTRSLRFVATATWLKGHSMAFEMDCYELFDVDIGKNGPFLLQFRCFKVGMCPNLGGKVEMSWTFRFLRPKWVNFMVFE